MPKPDARTHWEGAAPGWARWEPTVAAWIEPATDAMLAMAGVETGARVLDVACGAGSQTLEASSCRVPGPGTERGLTRSEAVSVPDRTGSTRKLAASGFDMAICIAGERTDRLSSRPRTKGVAEPEDGLRRCGRLV
jgi:hypothetical protein